MARAYRCLAAAPLLFLAALVPTIASAQTTVDGRVWISINVQERSGTTSPWRWAADAIVRTRDGIADIDSTLFRGIFGYDVSRRSSVWGGYAIAPSYPAIGGTVFEHRVFGQYSWSASAGSGALALRSRVEARDFDGNDALIWRLRQQVRYSRPVVTGSRFSLVFYDEVAVHANDTRRSAAGLEQNRVFAGIGRTLTGALRLEVGYLNQYSRSRVPPHRLNHILSVVSTIAL